MGQSITADGITLTTFAREHVDPLFKQAGARKMGRRYEFTNAAGDISLFDLFSRGYGGGHVGFDAGWQITPRSGVLFRQWMLRDLGSHVPPITHLQCRLWSSGLTPPLEVEEIGHWGFHDASSARQCGELLAAAITTTVIPLLIQSMDRRWLMETFSSGSVFEPRWMIGTPERTRVLLLIDDERSADLNQALEDLEVSTKDPRTREGDQQMLRWARQRLNRTPSTR